MSLTIEQILSVADRKVDEVDLPEWGGTVMVRSLSAGEQIDLEQALATLRDSNDLKELLSIQIAAYLSTQDGAALLSLEQARELIQRKPAAIRKLIGAAQKLNGWTEEARDELRGN